MFLYFIIIALFYTFRLVKYYLKENGHKDADTTTLLVDELIKKQSYVDQTKGLVHDKNASIYRYIGKVEDNYLEYSGILFRIVGIDKDNNIKAISDSNLTLMYSGLEKDLINHMYINGLIRVMKNIVVYLKTIWIVQINILQIHIYVMTW